MSLATNLHSSDSWLAPMWPALHCSCPTTPSSPLMSRHPSGFCCWRTAACNMQATLLSPPPTPPPLPMHPQPCRGFLGPIPPPLPLLEATTPTWQQALATTQQPLLRMKTPFLALPPEIPPPPTILLPCTPSVMAQLHQPYLLVMLATPLQHLALSRRSCPPPPRHPLPLFH
jgi:hypothetical protein